MVNSLLLEVNNENDVSKIVHYCSSNIELFSVELSNAGKRNYGMKVRLFAVSQ